MTETTLDGIPVAQVDPMEEPAVQAELVLPPGNEKIEKAYSALHVLRKRQADWQTVYYQQLMTIDPPDIDSFVGYVLDKIRSPEDQELDVPQVAQIEQKYVAVLDQINLPEFIDVNEQTAQLMREQVTDELWFGLTESFNRAMRTVDYEQVIEVLAQESIDDHVQSIYDVANDVVFMNSMAWADLHRSEPYYDQASNLMINMENMSLLYQRYSRFMGEPITESLDLGDTKEFLAAFAQRELPERTLYGLEGMKIDRPRRGIVNALRDFVRSDTGERVMDTNPLLATGIRHYIEKVDVQDELIKTPIDQADVAALREAYDYQRKQDNDPLTPEDRAVDAIVQRYSTIIGGEVHLRDQNTDRRRADYDFVQAVREVLADRSYSQEELRLLQTDLLALHYMMVGGGLEEMIQDWEAKTGTSYLWLKPEEREDLEVTLMNSFMQGVRARSGEKGMLERPGKIPTLGMELNTYDMVMELTDSYRLMMVLEALIKREKLPDLDHIETDQLEKIMSEFDLGNGDKDEKDTSSWSKLEVILRDAGEGVRFLNFLGKRKAKYREIFGWDDNQNLQEKPALESIEMLAKNALVSMQRFQSIGPLRFYWDSYDPEYVSRPVANPKTLWREQWLLLKNRMLETVTIPHVTVGGVEIRPGRVSFFEVRALLTGGGYLSDGIPDNMYQRASLKGEVINGESVVKISEIEDKKLVIPYHRLRTLGKPLDSAFDGRPTAYHGGQASAVELRSFRRISWKDLRQWMRVGSFAWLSAWGENAAYVAVENRTPQEVALAGAWEEMMNTWDKLREEQGMQPLREEEICVDVTEAYEELRRSQTMNKLTILKKDASKPAMRYFDSIDHAAASSPLFKAGCQQAIFRYSQQVKDILGIV